MFLLATDFRKNSELVAIKTPFVFREGFFLPIDFSDFPKESEKFGIVYNPLIIEGWYIFAIKDFKKSSILNYKIKLIEKIRETYLFDKKNDERFFIEFFKNDYLNSHIVFFRFVEKKVTLNEEVLKAIESVFQLFLKLNMIEGTDIIPLLKLFFTQVELNLPYVHYTTKEDKYSLLYSMNSFIFTINYKTFEKYEKITYEISKLNKETILE